MSIEPPPSKSTGRQIAETGVEAGLSAVPLVGGPAAVVLKAALSRAYDRRTEDWLASLAEEVNRLSGRVDGLSVEQMSEDPVFVDAVVNATRAALASHNHEKLAALRNGVLHSLDNDAPSADEQARFFRLVDEFTAAHLRLLMFLDNPQGVFDRNGISPPDLYAGPRSAMLEAALPEFADRSDWYELLFGDIRNASLVNGELTAMQTGRSLLNPITTPLGKRFLAFIADPEL